MEQPNAEVSAPEPLGALKLWPIIHIYVSDYDTVAVQISKAVSFKEVELIMDKLLKQKELMHGSCELHHSYGWKQPSGLAKSLTLMIGRAQTLGWDFASPQDQVTFNSPMTYCKRAATPPGVWPAIFKSSMFHIRLVRPEYHGAAQGHVGPHCAAAATKAPEAGARN
jgi:hypothetical protein